MAGGVINTSKFLKALWPGVNTWFGQAYNEWPDEYKDLFDIESSSKAFEEEVGFSGLGLAIEKPQGSPVQYDDMQQGFTMRYVPKTYALGFMITEEMIEDNQYDSLNIGKKDAKALKFAMKQTKEILAANVYNRAFDSNYKYGDGVQLLSNAHPTRVGGTFSNVAAVSADISEASLEQACLAIEGFTNDRGLAVSFKPNTLHIHKDSRFEVERILKSVQQNDTANNAINALRSLNMFPGGVKVNHYFTDNDAWFIRTNCPDGMKMFNRKDLTFRSDNDVDTFNAKFLAYFRVSFGVSDPRGIWGNPGA